jgi:Sugar (and other) transporter
MSKARLVITAVTVEKRPVSEVARSCGVARSWIYALLARYEDGYDISPELEEIADLEVCKQQTSKRNSGWSVLRQHWVRPALLVGCGIAAFTQLSGIEMIIYYAPTILTHNHFSTTAAYGSAWGSA